MKFNGSTCSFGILLLGVAMSACSPMRFSQYSGPNRRSPISQESMAETSFGLPVFRGWPNRPYEILGSLRFEDPRQYWDDGVIEAAVSAAKRKGGDAIVIREGTEFGVSGTIGSSEDRMVLSQGQTSALVIKWKSPQAVAAEEAKVQAFKGRFRAAHPELCRSSSVFDEATKYLLWTGADIDSPATMDQFRDVLTDLQGPRDGELNGKWIFHCSVRKSHLTTSDSHFFYGIASVSLRGDVLTIVSTGGGTEVNFSGTFDKGRIAGKMGIATVSMSCDGVAAPEKVSLSGQGQTADGTCQASLVFQR